MKSRLSFEESLKQLFKNENFKKRFSRDFEKEMQDAWDKSEKDAIMFGRELSGQSYPIYEIKRTLRKMYND